MPLSFHKMHANGDDFVVVDSRSSANPVTSSLVRRLGDRNRGIGFNQLAVVLDCDDAAARLMFWNADGSTLDTCGSATRGAADMLMREANTTSIVLRTNRGLLTCERTPVGSISVNMGEPLFDWSDIPLALELDTAVLPLVGSPAACNMGNPHCTYFVNDLTAVDLATIGRTLKAIPCSPSERTCISSRSSTESTFGCVSGSAGAEFRSVRVPARAARPSTAFVVVCWTIPSTSNAMAAR